MTRKIRTMRPFYEFAVIPMLEATSIPSSVRQEAGHQSPIEDIQGRERYEFNKLQKRLRRLTGQAIVDYNMIEEGDKVMVCLSGGKDSYTMLDILMSLQKTAPIRFDLVAVNMDQKQPGFPEEVLPNYLSKLGIEYHIIEKDTYSVVKRVVPEGKTTCGLCSRLRRGTLYGFADEIGATKIALGHHRDDIIETLFLNLFYGGKLKAMPPKLLADDKRNIVIRPLAYCAENDIETFAKLKGFPIIPCNLCGSQENLQRQAIKDMLQQWEKQFPGRTETIFSAIQNVAPSQLADMKLFDFINLTIDRNNSNDEEDTCALPMNSPNNTGVQFVDVMDL
jgi:tRNA 2-thiocytidine biosynthesis protein TtcA